MWRNGRIESGSSEWSLDESMPVLGGSMNDILGETVDGIESGKMVALKAAGKKRRERTDLNPTQSQALKSSEWESKWWPATMAEFEYMTKIGAGEKVEKSEVPFDEQIIDTKMDYLVKVTPNGV